MEKLRFGIVGIGNMGSSHAMNLNAGVVPEIELTAVCDIKEDRRQWAKEHLKDSVQIYSDAIEMYEKAPIDAVIVATPHYFHPSLVIAALNHGLHAISEKPIGVYTLAAKEEIEVARKSDKVFGIMFNQRTNPVYQKVKELVSSGEIGEIKRVVWLITDWYRSQSY